MSVHDFDKKFSCSINNLNKSKISDGNKKSISRFVENCFSEGIGKARIVKYIYALIKLSTWLEKDFSNTNKDDIKKLVGEIEKSNYSDWSKHDLKVCLKKFYRWIKGLDEGNPEETR